jgi:DNA sulfur modification protein DndD
MLWLSRVEIDGFGPYAKRTEFTFPDAPGVVIVHGLNNRGKTSLLNAIYFAFFDVVRDRDLRPWPLVEAENEENAATGQHGFSVKLVFRFEGATYELDRRVAPRRGIARPTVDEDYERSWFLARDGDQLDSLEAARTMSRVLPQDVARFFLFDGELLTEYSRLLDDADIAGRKISAAIEMILGVPILKAARAHVSAAAEAAGRAVEREAAKDAQTAQIGEAIRRTREARDAHIAERRRKQVDLEGYSAELEEVDGYLRARDRYRDAMERRERAGKARDAARDEEARLRDQLRVQMSEAWRTVLGDKVREAREVASDSVAGLFAEVAMRLQIDAIEACHCGTCGQDVPPDAISRLEAMLPDGARSADQATPIGVAAFGRSKVLNAFRETDVRPAVTILAAGIERARMEQIARGDEIRDLDADLVHADEDTLRDKSTTRAALLAKIVGAEKAIDDETREIDAATSSIARMNGLLEAAGDSPLAAFKRRAAFLTAAGEVFESSVERFKADLRDKVEATSSAYFARMTTEPDYTGLSINESYGLTVVHRDGRLVRRRAASTEQVVALALMGAIQANSPLKGPIIMDTPFARLDPYHTAKVVQVVPDMAQQVILLVQEGELRRDEAERLLGGRLVYEFTLHREGAFETSVTGGAPA